MGTRIDLVGKRFGRLTVKEYSHSQDYGYCVKVFWMCECDCGKKVARAAGALRSGNTKSCGCLHSEKCGLNGLGNKINHETAYKQILQIYIGNARKNGREWGLPEDIFKELIGGNCVYCGTPPAKKSLTEKSKRVRLVYNGIDRIDNAKGYIIGNVASCCNMCNHAKKTHTAAEFLACYPNSISTSTRKIQNSLLYHGLSRARRRKNSRRMNCLQLSISKPHIRAKVVTLPDAAAVQPIPTLRTCGVPCQCATFDVCFKNPLQVLNLDKCDLHLVLHCCC